jgi:cytoskeletal protein RodZ
VEATFSDEIQVTVLSSNIYADTTPLNTIIFIVVIIGFVALIVWIVIWTQRRQQKKRESAESAITSVRWT